MTAKDHITELLLAAMERHIKLVQTDTIQQGFLPSRYLLEIDRDVEARPAFCNDHATDSDGSTDDWSGTIEAGRYFMQDAFAHQYRLLRATPELIAEWAAPPGEEPPYYIYRFSTLSLALSGDERHTYILTVFDLLALMAAQDARAGGRDSDAELMLGLIPVVPFVSPEPWDHPLTGVDTTQLIPAPLEAHTLTSEQEDEIIRHLETPSPLTVRGGGKRFTEAMAADTRKRLLQTVDGYTYTHAGNGDNGLAIRSNDPGAMLTADVGTNKLLVQLADTIVKDGLSVKKNEALVVRTSVAEVLELRGKEATRKNKKRVRDEALALASQVWIWTDKRGSHVLPLSGGQADILRDGTIRLKFSYDFVTAVMGHDAAIVPVDPLMQQIDANAHPAAWAIGYRLTVNQFMNHGGANEFRISVRSLLDYVKNLPTYDEVEATDRGHQTGRIVAPMERDLNYLVELGVLEYWEYCHTNSEPLTDAEQEQRLDAEGNEKPLPYETAINCLIEWRPTHSYPGAMQAWDDARKRKSLEAAEAKAKRDAESKASSKRIQRKKEQLIAKHDAEKAIAERDKGGAD